MEWRARWFDGRDSAAHDAQVNFAGDLLEIHLAGPGPGRLPLVTVPARDLIAGERYAGAPRKLQLPDGSALQVEDDEQGRFERSLRQQGHRPGPVENLTRRWTGAIACLVMLMAFLVWMDRQGAGVLASAAVPVVPRAVDQKLGGMVMNVLQDNYLAPTQVSEARRDALRARARELVERQYPQLGWRLLFFDMRDRKNAFNAFTLPDGSILLLDGLTDALTDEQLLAVFGHELGHVVHRHTLQRLLRQVGLAAIAGVVVGDVSSLLATVAAGFQDLHFSRDAEREADAFAAEFLRRGGVPVSALAEAFEVMRRMSPGGSIPGFFSTHPRTEERIKAAEAAARE